MPRVVWIAVVSALAKTAAGGVLPSRDLEASSVDDVPVLECFQVSTPVLTDKGLVSAKDVVAPANGSQEPTASCQQTLVNYSFQNSYGKPYVADYYPPDCDFNHVSINLTVASEGIQYDRLAIMYLGDIEVWRTSTAEPKSHPGISWSYWKDMTNYLSLWKANQKVIFDLGNIVNDQYTGAYNVALTATFFSSTVTADNSELEPASWIGPISAKKGADGQGSAFNYPKEDTSVSITLPRNARRAIVSISATGQSDEEFWETNVPDSVQANGTGIFGKSAFREARLLIDGQIAGLAWPYPVVFTGGISPPLHRPLVGVQAFDLLESEIDITPWLGVLCDGKAHIFSLQVVGENEQQPNSYWLLTGKAFVWFHDNNDQTTTGSAPTVTISPARLSSSGGSRGGPLVYSQSIARSIQVSSRIKIAGEMRRFEWNQRYSMHNSGNITNGGNDQFVKAIYEGESTAKSDAQPYFYLGFEYPFEMNLKSRNEDNSLKLTAYLAQGMSLAVMGKSAFSYGIDAFSNRLETKVSGSALHTRRTSTATFYQNPDGSRTSGGSESHQIYKFGGQSPLRVTGQYFSPTPLLYSREVDVVGNRTVQDDVYVYDSDFNAAPGNASPNRFVQDFAPISNPQKPGMAKFVGKAGQEVASVGLTPETT